MGDSTPRHFHPPTPASTLLARLRKTQIDPSTGLKLGRLKTGVEDVDEYLFGGGVQRGCVVGVSSGITSPNRREAPGGRGYPSAGDAEGDTGRLLTIHILARSLLERPHSHASVIDSTGSFPLALFAGVVRWCVERGVGAGSGSGVGVSSDIGGKGWGNGGGGRGGLEEKVNAVLERVGVTRVFDIEGLWEVLGEVGGATRRTEGGDAHAASIKEDGGLLPRVGGCMTKKRGEGVMRGALERGRSWIATPTTTTTMMTWPPTTLQPQSLKILKRNPA
ncbi:hypothetical protein VC83_00042 [Pseudogymnoascus destructans]|uniref:Uncharacterized protein n=1 Tax=Pseudogymnoascus destructans TaxID=655981 RepID=A0A177AP43_9PEZI|nr:uncharacterized protein VC83_00042 [Pseudogymnoascus destructans]OAF63292.1 hypothetical protein VC83_00042 [Pseudogymnoascus destructans]